MQNAASEPLIDSDPEIQAPPPEELVNKILELRAKSNAKNNPKKPKSAAPRPVRAPASIPDSPLKSAEQEAVVLPDFVPASEGKLAENMGQHAAHINEKLEKLAAGVEKITQQIDGVQEQFGAQNSARDKAFDLLYEEMNGYKNDFFIERLKPTLRSLLFLLDSIEEFEREVQSHETEGAAVPVEIIKANLIHFRDQLTDTLFMSEMAPIEAQDDKFDAKTQRAVQVVKVEAEQNNTVQRQIRGGWTLGGKMLRPADVVVGKSG